MTQVDISILKVFSTENQYDEGRLIIQVKRVEFFKIMSKKPPKNNRERQPGRTFDLPLSHDRKVKIDCSCAP